MQTLAVLVRMYMDMMQVHTCNYKYNKHQLHNTHRSKYGAYYT